MFSSKEMVWRNIVRYQAISSMMMCSWTTIANFWLPSPYCIFAKAICLMKRGALYLQIASAGRWGNKSGRSVKKCKKAKKHFQTLLSRNIFICWLSESVYFWISSVNLWKTRLTGYIGNEPWNGHWDNSSCERMAIRGEIFAPQLFCRDRHLIYTLLSPGMQAMNHHRCWQLVKVIFGRETKNQKTSTSNKLLEWL